MTTRRLTRKAPLHTRALRALTSDKFKHTAPAGIVFAVAAYQSYWHTAEVTAAAGENVVTAHIMALSIDGLMIVAARYITHSRTTLAKVISFTFFMLGVIATLTMNIKAADPNTFSRAVAMWPAVALIGTAAMLHWGEMKPKARKRIPLKVAAPRVVPLPIAVKDTSKV